MKYPFCKISACTTRYNLINKSMKQLKQFREDMGRIDCNETILCTAAAVATGLLGTWNLPSLPVVGLEVPGATVTVVALSWFVAEKWCFAPKNSQHFGRGAPTADPRPLLQS